MFERKVEKELIQWKKDPSPKKKAFLLKGLRQIGKTTSILDFANKNYKNVFYINFKLEPEMKRAFSENLDVSSILSIFSYLRPGFVFVPKETVLIFDEVQECAGARSSVKSFIEDGNYDVIESGSLLGVSGYNHKYKGGIPVGFEHIVYMYPMDFEEFLWAKGISKNSINDLRECFEAKKEINPTIHSVMERYFREYICVGGMPSAVDVFLTTHNFSQVLKEQKDLLENFRDDYGKHLNENEEEVTDLALLSKINKVFDSIPSQLAKENKKFIYNVLGKKASSTIFDPAIQWLKDYGLIQLCHNLSCLESPLEGNKVAESFKIYLSDSGLLMAMLEEGAQKAIMEGDLSTYKGAIYENAIADIFVKNGKKLYYYSKPSGLKIDFVLSLSDHINIVEIKATNGNTKSARTILENKDRYKDVEGMIKISESNLGSVSNKVNVPHYLSFLL